MSRVTSATWGSIGFSPADVLNPEIIAGKSQWAAFVGYVRVGECRLFGDVSLLGTTQFTNEPSTEWLVTNTKTSF